MKRNAAREALNRAVNKAIADGSPVFVNQPAMPTTHRYERNVNPSIGKLNVCLFCSEPFQHPNHIATGSLPYVCEIVSADGEVEISTNVASVSEAVQWLRDNGISMEQIDAVPRVDYCIFRYQRKAAVPCYVCQGTCLGHDPIEPGDVFESTSGNLWQVVIVKDREFGQYAEVFSPNCNPQYHYCWSVDSLRMMRRLEPNDPKHPAWDEYDRAASDLARKGLTGAKGDPLPNLMTPEAVSLINSDPEAFQQRVKGFAYAYAMASTKRFTCKKHGPNLEPSNCLTCAIACAENAKLDPLYPQRNA